MNAAPSSSVSRSAGPPPYRHFLRLLVLGLLLAASIHALEWDIGALLDNDRRDYAFGRLRTFLAGFGSPDLSAEYLGIAWKVSLQTLGTALLGTALGAVFGYIIALGAARCVVLGDDPPPPRGRRAPIVFLSWWGRRVFIEGCRLVLDTLRGVPDFAWAVMLVMLTGLGPVTGTLAIAVSVAGILGKIYSELWDNVQPRLYEPLRTTGAGRLGVFFFGVQPHAARSMLSFTLMRLECAVRNASVIGVVGGGGLGAELKDQLAFSDYDKAATILIFLIGVTASVDILSNFFRSQLRNDPNHRRAARTISRRASNLRRVAACAFAAGLIGLALYALRDEYERFAGLFRAQQWGYIGIYFTDLVKPDVSWTALQAAFVSAKVPVAIAFIGTLGAVVLAGMIAYPASLGFQTESHRFTGEHPALLTRVRRWLCVLLARGIALFARSVPEVSWVMIFMILLRPGALTGIIAIAVHSMGVLARVFTETVDNVPYRRFEQAYSGSRINTFLYAALPTIKRDWATYAFFQFESNIRMGVVLGMIGVGGLGHEFNEAWNFNLYSRTGTYLLVMVLLTSGVDRVSRLLKLSRAQAY